jgi:hypothetical protein
MLIVYPIGSISRKSKWSSQPSLAVKWHVQVQGLAEVPVQFYFLASGK